MNVFLKGKRAKEAECPFLVREGKSKKVKRGSKGTRVKNRMKGFLSWKIHPFLPNVRFLVDQKLIYLDMSRKRPRGQLFFPAMVRWANN